MTQAFKAAILTYHSISGGPLPLCISYDVFVAQMHWLRANVRVVPLAVLAGFLAKKTPPPEPSVALTFDDGLSDFYSAAAPVLRNLDLPATVFLPAAYCGRRSDWQRYKGPQAVMSWKQVGELAKQGISFGSHGMSHLVLTGLTDGELTIELEESKRRIQAETGQQVRFFCYPYGIYDARTRRAVSERYWGACSTDLRALAPDDDPFALPRIDVHYLRRPAILGSLFTARFGMYLSVRRILRALHSKRRHSH
jgi:peptidoglycan/xylan/chitin deacetylase (PgdA/CDA1 family)